MRNWAEYDVNTVRNDKDLWSEFRADYLAKFGEVINENCKKRYIYKFEKLVKMFEKKENTHGYRLKLMYNGIVFNGKIYRNDNLTAESAIYLLNNHKAGKDLFDKLPLAEPKAEPKATVKKTRKKVAKKS